MRKRKKNDILNDSFYDFHENINASQVIWKIFCTKNQTFVIKTKTKARNGEWKRAEIDLIWSLLIIHSTFYLFCFCVIVI